MSPLNWTRIAVGGALGGLAFNAISIAMEIPLYARYTRAQAAGHFLSEARFAIFPLWVMMLLCAGMVGAWMYAHLRRSLGPGPQTAALLGLVLGGFMGIPMNLAQAAWSPAGRLIPLIWCLESVIGMTAAVLIAGFLYREKG